MGAVRTLPGTVSKVATATVEFFRAVPLVNQMMFAYYVAAPFIFPESLEPLTVILICSVMTLALVMGSRVSEHVYGAIKALPSSQTQAALTQGFSRYQTYKLFLVPQAIRNAFPALTSEFMSTVKNSTIAGKIGLLDFLMYSQKINEFTSTVYEPLVIACIGFFAFNYIISKAMQQVEQRAFKMNAVTLQSSLSQ